MAELNLNLHSLFLFVFGLLCLLLFAGMVLLQTGLLRAKNTMTCITKNMITLAICLVLGGLLGNQVIRDTLIAFLNHHQATSMALELNRDFMRFFQFFLPAIGLSIVAAATAERLKLWAFLIFSVCFIVVSYPVNHYLSQLALVKQFGFTDFGAGKIFLASAIAGLTGTALLGPRLDKYDQAGQVFPHFASNMPLAVIGAFMVWVGFLGYYGGVCFLNFSPNAVEHFAKATANAMLISSISMVVCTTFTRIAYGAIDLSFILNSLIASLIALAAFPNAHQSVVILAGLGCGALTVPVCWVFEKCRVDDPTGLASMALLGSLIGLLVVAAANTNQMSWVAHWLAQSLGLIIISCWSLISSIGFWLFAKALIGLRTEPEIELRGLDIYDCANNAYSDT